MKKLLLFTGTLLISSLSYSQIQGDINNQSFAMDAFHDADRCLTQVTPAYMINISNSFMGDSVKIVDPSNGIPLYSYGNTTGDVNWSFVVPLPMMMEVSDQQVINNWGTVAFPYWKIISGPDTLFPNGMATFPVNNPCTYGDVSGRTYIDVNNDCVFNAGDVPLSGIYVDGTVNITNGTGTFATGWSTNTNNNGHFNLNLQETWMTDYTVQFPNNYQFIFPPSSCAPTSQAFNSLPQTNVDFALQCADIDVSCGVYSAGPVRPAIPFKLFTHVKNTGCDSAAGILKLVLDPNVTYNAGLSSNIPSSISGDTLIWNYSGLTNLSNGNYWSSFMSGLHLTPNVSVNIGDILCFEIFTGVPSNDIDASNNQSMLCVPVVNSYDPNIKEVSPKGLGTEGFIPDSVDEFIYTVHFQNTGNAPAIDVHIVDSLQQNLNPNSLRIITASHVMTPSWLSSNVVKFDFPNINLADSISDEPNSHGFVIFKIKVTNPLQPGDEIKNKAHIYFDTNPAIITNTALNTIMEDVSSINDANKSPLEVYPNPSNGIYHVKLPENASKNNTLTVYNIVGKPIQNADDVKDITQIDISQFPNGVYIIVVHGEQSFKKIIMKQ